MKNIINRLRSKCVDKCLFIDKVSGRAVRVYERKDGTTFMAESKFNSIFFFVEQSK